MGGRDHRSQYAVAVGQGIAVTDAVTSTEHMTARPVPRTLLAAGLRRCSGAEGALRRRPQPMVMGKLRAGYARRLR